MAGDGAVSYEFKPVTRETLSDLARFSECHGRFRYCSCMRWRMRSSEFKDSTAEERAAALEALVKQAVPVGVLAYAGGEPVGWCSVAPRESYEALDRYKALQRIDAQPVWSVVCFFVDRRYRRQGVTLALLKAAVDYARSQGATIVEGYPVDAGSKLYTYMGLRSTFLQAGFRDVTPPGRERAVVRYMIE